MVASALFSGCAGAPSPGDDAHADGSTNCGGDASCAGDPDCEGAHCKSSTCGNGVLDPGEECDDGNLVSGDGCELDCTFSCHHDEECLDDDLCTVGERCVEVSGGKRCQAGARVQCPPEDANPCLMYTCDPDAEELGYCRSEALTGCYPDEDRDGFPLLDESRRVDPVGASCSCPEIDGVRYIHPPANGVWDCDDRNALRYPGAIACYQDADGDGFPRLDTAEAMGVDCSCAAPLIPRREDGLFDCDDADPRVHPIARCVFDRDGDGFPADEDAAPMNAACECPASAMLEREDGLFDCDDEDHEIYPGAMACHADDDLDGFPAPDPVAAMDMECVCSAPLIPPRADRRWDCDDTSAHSYPGARCVFDRDGDGYPVDEDAAGMDSACGCEDNAIPAREDGLFDCDDEDVNIYPSAPCFPDDDGDGFYASNARGQMDSACACPAGEAPLDPDAPVDCDDTNDDVRPDQTAYFTEGYCPGEGKGASCPADANSFDYNCDLEEEFAGESACGQNYDSCCGLPPNLCWGVEVWKTPSPRCGQVEPILTCLDDCSAISGSSRVPCR